MSKVLKIASSKCFLQYFKKEGTDKIDFLHADKHQTFLQVDAINHGGHGEVYPNYTKEQVCKVFAIFQNFCILGQFWIKLGPKWPIIVPNEVFWTLIKIESLILAGITFK